MDSQSTPTDKPTIAARIVLYANVLACVAIVGLTIALLIHKAPTYHGVDSYYYLLYANDLVEAPRDTSLARYFYFPGTYAFWSVIASFVGRHLPAYQYGFVGICMVDAGLIALILRAAGCSPIVAGVSFLAYVSMGEFLELYVMTTEAITVFPALLGIFLWLVFSQREKPKIASAALGIGYGLCVFTKQQGAFVAMGAIGVLFAAIKRPFEWRVFRELGLVTLIALLTLACAFAIDGGGLRALQQGVAGAVNYQAIGDFREHLLRVYEGTTKMSITFGIASVTNIVALVLSARRTISIPPAVAQLWPLATMSALMPLAQFSRRPYGHYVLLSLPFVLITIGIAATWLYEQLVVPSAKRIDKWLTALVSSRKHSAGETLQKVLLFGAGAMKFAAIGGLTYVAAREISTAWNAEWNVGPPRHTLFGQLCRDISPGKPLLLLPSRDNGLHWACKTHARGTKWGYTFNFQENPEDYIAEIQKPEIEQVFVFEARSGTYEHQVRAQHNWSPFFSELPKRGFAKVRTSYLGTLYKRNPH